MSVVKTDFEIRFFADQTDSEIRFLRDWCDTVSEIRFATVSEYCMNSIFEIRFSAVYIYI